MLQDQEAPEEPQLLNATLASHYFDDYVYMLPLHARQRGLAYMGSNERLRTALDRYINGEQARSLEVTASARLPIRGNPSASHPGLINAQDFMHGISSLH